MKAEQIITEHSCGSQQVGDGSIYLEIEIDEAIKAMKEYARIQIEKDRERIKANSLQYPDYVRDVISTTPITLD